jgi:hypothetical protein
MRPWEKPGTVFLLWRPENGETIADAREVEAHDAEDAAEDWAEYDDSYSVEYMIVRGNDATVCVRERDNQDAPVQTFVVSGKTVPQYTAREVQS